MVHDEDDVHLFKELNPISGCSLERSLNSDKYNHSNSCHNKREIVYYKYGGKQY